MRFGVVGNLVAHAWPEQERAAILELRVQLTFQAEQDVAFGAPVIRDVARAVVHPPDPDRTEVAGALGGHPGLAKVLRGFHGGPVRGAEGDARHFHEGLLWRRVRDPPRHQKKPPEGGFSWRREGDSNPRYWFTQYTRLAGEPDRPLRHLSKAF